jgi:Mg-chelatase subunit ChlD
MSLKPVVTTDERLRRWRLILGGGAADGTGCGLSAGDLAIDGALGMLYDGAGAADEPDRSRTKDRKGGLGGSAPRVARWLGDIREYFPTSVVQVMQKDALERLGLREMLMQPELLASMEPNVHLVADILSLSRVMPGKTRETARLVVRKVVDDLLRKLSEPLRQAVTGSLNRATRTRRPRLNEIDWNRTIRANLKHYQPEHRTIIPESRIGFGRKRSALREIVLCIDQSGSMATSVVYAGIFAAVLASLPSVRTRVVVFDTSVVDLSEMLDDPVELLFGTQLGGGTDINRALGYCQSLVRQPTETILVLVSDLYEGGDRAEMIRRVGGIVSSGVQMIALLALNDDGAPSFDHGIASQLAGFAIPSFACTPDQFPDLMAAAIGRHDLQQWAAARGVVTARTVDTKP